MLKSKPVYIVKKTRRKYAMIEDATPMDVDDRKKSQKKIELINEESSSATKRKVLNNKKSKILKSDDGEDISPTSTLHSKTSDDESEMKITNASKSESSKKSKSNADLSGRKRSLPTPTGQAKRQKVVLNRFCRHSRGSVLTVGQGDVGQLGLGENIMERKKPNQVWLPENIVDICVGGMHTVCLSEGGKVYTFGCNDEGALGRDTEDNTEFFPGVVNVDGRVVQISAGDSHTSVLTDDGRVFAWGTFRDSSGSMGLLATCIQMTPQPLLAGTPVSKIVSGSDHLVLLTTAGHLYTCGCAEQGQLGRVAECFSIRGGRRGLALLLNPGLAVVRRHRGKQQLLFDDVWTGSYSTFVRIRDSKDIYVCGLNNYNQLGSEDIKNHFILERSESFSSKKWVQISGGQHHTLALDEKGKVYALGRKDYGRLGLGKNTNDAMQPTLIPTLRNGNCVDIACGVATSYAVAHSGTIYAWGMGTNGALGTGDEEDKHIPTAMMSKQLEAQKTIAVSSGGQHAVLLIATATPPIPSSNQ